MTPVTERVMLLLNAEHHPVPFVLPPGPWASALDSAAGTINSQAIAASDLQLVGVCNLRAQTLQVMVQPVDTRSVNGPPTDSAGSAA